MKKTSLLILLCLLQHCLLTAQIFPAEGGKLTYRLIGFACAHNVSRGHKMKLQIAVGRLSSENSFKKSIITTISTDSDKVIALVPSFGCDYTWRTICSDKNDGITKSPLHHFQVMPLPEADSNLRFRILQNAIKYNEAHIFLDATRTLCDMKGNIVWFLPDIDSSVSEQTKIVDLKLTANGTITFIASLKNKEQIYEINYNGDVIWQGPANAEISGNNQEHYHHEFTKLENGNYMVLGTEYVNWKKNKLTADAMISPAGQEKESDTNFVYYKTLFGTIIEYDKAGKIVWSWHSAQYFLKSDLIFYPSNLRRKFIDMHENSFFFDEKNGAIYLSCKTIDRVIKINYPDGKVLNIYGPTYGPDEVPQGPNLFCGQHSCKKSCDGSLLLYNNNFCDSSGHPSILKMQEPRNDKERIKTVWKYECPVEEGYNTSFAGGGNVMELPDSSIFVSMGSSYSKLFIVSQDKTLLFSALPEKWNPNAKKWDPINLYRASIIPDRTDLERLIWNAVGL